MQPKAVFRQLAFLALRTLEAYERAHSADDPSQALIAGIRRSGARIEYWLHTFTQTASVWESDLRQHEVVPASKLPPDVDVTIHSWLYDRLRDEAFFSHALTRFALRFLRQQLYEDLKEYVDRHGRAVVSGTLVFWDGNVWEVRSAKGHVFRLASRGQRVTVVSAEQMARSGTKLSDQAKDVVPEADVLARDPRLLRGYYQEGRRLRAEAERQQAVRARAAEREEAARAAEAEPVGASVQAAVTANVNLHMAKRAAWSNLTGFKRSRFSVLHTT